ncbi:hypothetical protein OWV82_015328 [Melia azedarach]|uniref:Uncharacterized protein n=1 Tax=Melia azedarach TaxID=155640 RepID=A0ACC1XR84_MELAZ|nr:hypothetical protein OWV82_015328 [Melia azedarach]
MSRRHIINIASVLLLFLVLSMISLTEARILNFQAIQESLLRRDQLVHRTLRAVTPPKNTPVAAQRIYHFVPVPGPTHPREARILNFQAIQESLLRRDQLVHRTLRAVIPPKNTPQAAQGVYHFIPVPGPIRPQGSLFR